MKSQEKNIIKKLIIFQICLFICSNSLSQISTEMESDLSKIIGDAKIVFLGEPTHGEGNVFEEKLEIIKFLVEKKGFNTIAFESPVYPSLLDYDDMFDQIYPIWTGAKQFQKTLEYLKSNSQLDVIGFDYQPMNEADLISELNKKLIEQKIDENQVNNWDSIISEIIFQDNQSDSIAIQFNQVISEIDPKIKNERVAKAFQNINLYSSHLIEYPIENLTFEEFKAWMNNPRDKQMANNLVAYVKEHPSAKIICWGASAHFMNSTNGFEEIELQKFTPMASLVKKELPQINMKSLAFVAGGGEYRSNETRKVTPHKVDSLSIEYKLKEKGSQIIDTKTESNFLSYALENKPFDVIWSDVFDGLVYLPKFEVPIYSWKPETIDGKVSGQVVDKNGEGVPYAIISSQDLKFITDVDGVFEVEVDSLIGYHISSVGYKDKNEDVVLNGKNNYIILEEDANDIEGVVVVGKRETAKQFMKRVINKIDENYPMDTIEYNFKRRKVLKLDSVDLIYDLSYDRIDNDGYSYRRAYMNNSTQYQTQNKQVSFSIIDNLKEHKLDSLPEEYAYIEHSKYHSSVRVDLLNYAKYSFLNKSKLSSFQLKYDNDKSTNNEVVIEVLNLNPNHVNSGLSIAPTSYKALVYINEQDLAITKVESYIELDKTKILNAKQYFPGAYKNIDIWFDRSIVEYSKDVKTRKYFISKAYITTNYSFENGGYIEWTITRK